MNLGAFTLVMLLLSAAVGAGTWLYMRRLEAGALREDRAPSGGRPGSRGGKEANVKDIWEVEDVRHGVLVLPGGRYRAVCRVSAADFWLLSDEQQDAVEDAAIAALRQLTFPVQVLVTSQSLDVRDAVGELRRQAAELPPALGELALARAEYLSALARNKAAAVRQAYMVIPYATSKGFEHARAELEARVLMLADALAGARLRLERLSSEALVDLLAHLLRRGRPWRPSEAVEAGAMALYHVSERSVVSGA